MPARNARGRLMLFVLLALAGMAVAWAVLHARQPLDDADPNSLKQGSIRGNRDGTPGQQLK